MRTTASKEAEINHVTTKKAFDMLVENGILNEDIVRIGNHPRYVYSLSRKGIRIAENLFTIDAQLNPNNY